MAFLVYIVTAVTALVVPIVPVVAHILPVMMDITVFGANLAPLLPGTGGIASAPVMP